MPEGVDAYPWDKLKLTFTSPPVAFPDREVAAVGTLGCSVWRNVDVRLAGGYGTAGSTAAVGVTLAIE